MPPRGAAGPRPASRSRWPSSTPAGHLDVDRARRAHAAVAAALVARVGMRLPGARARDARRRGDDLAEDRAADLRAPRRCRRTRRSAPGACRARSPSPRSASHATGRRTSTVRGGAERGLGEVELHDRLGVGRARRARLAARRRTGRRRRTRRRGRRSRTRRRPPGTGRAAPRAVVAEDVVAAAALGIAQRLVRDG